MDIKLTTNPVVAALYNGFIGPDGNFYIVSSKASHEPTHEEWATNFVLNNTNYISLLLDPSGSMLFTLSKLKSKQDMLIHFYGYVYYSHDLFTREPIIICPDYEINNVKITKQQEYMLYEIMSENNELENFPFDVKRYVDEEKHNLYVDRFICKRLEQEMN